MRARARTNLASFVTDLVNPVRLIVERIRHLHRRAEVLQTEIITVKGRAQRERRSTHARRVRDLRAVHGAAPARAQREGELAIGDVVNDLERRRRMAASAREQNSHALVHSVTLRVDCCNIRTRNESRNEQLNDEAHCTSRRS